MKKLLFALSLLVPVWFYAQTWANQNSSITNDLRAVHFIDANNGWAVGRQGKVVRTNNGGTSWTEQNSGTSNDLYKVFMVNANVGYAVGKSGTFIKYNGTSWSTISIGFSQDMHGVYFLDENTGWVSGDWGRIMMTTNGGTSWTTQVNNSMYSNLFYDLHMISASEGWAVGTSGRVLRYNGTSWSNVTTPASADLYSVHFTNTNVGFMTGRNSTVFHYNGTSWTSHNTALPDNSYHIKGVFTVNNNLAFAATTAGFGGVGIILKYNGSTWVKDYEYSGIGGEYFDAVTVAPGGKAYVVGAGGVVKSALSEAASVSEYNSNIKEYLAYPNPFQNKVNIKFNALVSEDYSWEVKDISGRILVTSITEKMTTGNNVLKINTENLSTGIYFYTIRSASGIISGKLMKE